MPRNQILDLFGEKKCGQCQKTLAVSSFGSNRAMPDGLQHHCFSCRRSYYLKNRQSILEEQAQRRRERVRKWVVYLIRLPDGCIYVGSTDDYANRQSHHRSDARYNKHRNKGLNRYHPEDFQFSILRECDSQEEAEQAEADHYRALWVKIGDLCLNQNNSSVPLTTNQGSLWSEESLREQIDNGDTLRVIAKRLHCGTRTLVAWLTTMEIPYLRQDVRISKATAARWDGKRGKRRPVTLEMQKAMDEVKEGAPVMVAARANGIPYGTLAGQLRRRGIVPMRKSQRLYTTRHPDSIFLGGPGSTLKSETDFQDQDGTLVITTLSKKWVRSDGTSRWAFCLPTTLKGDVVAAFCMDEEDEEVEREYRVPLSSLRGKGRRFVVVEDGSRWDRYWMG